MSQPLFTLGLCMSTALSSCACALTDEIARPDQREANPRAAMIGLAVYEPRSDVACLTSAVRHVLMPQAPFPATTNSDGVVSGVGAKTLTKARGP